MADEPKSDAEDAEELDRTKKYAIFIESLTVLAGLASIAIGFVLSRSKTNDLGNSFWISLAIGLGTSLLLVGILLRVQRVIAARLDATSEALYTRQAEISKQLDEMTERLVAIQRETSSRPDSVTPAPRRETEVSRPPRTMVLADWLATVLIRFVSYLRRTVTISNLRLVLGMFYRRTIARWALMLANAGRAAKRWAIRHKRLLILIVVIVVAAVAVLVVVRIVDGPNSNGNGHAVSSGAGDCDHDGDAGDPNEANECAQQTGSGSKGSEPTSTSSTTVPLPTGEQILTDGGTVTGIEGAPDFGSTAPLPSGVHAVGIATTSDGQGYWIATSDGGVQNFGDAHFFGSAAGASSQAFVGIAALPNDQGYWLLNESGQVYSFGQAQYYGGYQPGPGYYFYFSGIASTHTGKGYWLAEEDGHVYSFGDAANLGGPSLSLPTSTSPFVTGIVAAPDGNGYWLLNTNGTVYNYGEAALGSAPDDAGSGGESGSASAIALNPAGGYSVLNLCGDVWSSSDGNVDSSAEDCTIRHIALAQ